MNEIDQLRADIATLEAALALKRRKGWCYPELDYELSLDKIKLAKLEAEEAKKDDPFWEAKETYIKWTETFHGGTHPLKHVADYVQHLEREASISRKNLSRVPDVYVLKNLKTGKFQSRDRFFEEIELYTYREKTRMQWLEGWCFVPYTGQEP